MTNERDAADLLRAMEDIGVSVWIGGGWGVDALLNFQSRPHKDIDIYTKKKNADKIVKMLTSKSYDEVKTEYTTEAHTFWQDSSGRIVDLHLIELDEAEGAETLFFENVAYPSNVLNGKGMIGGVEVRCFSAGAQLLFHQGYEHNENDAHDVMLLCKTFGLDAPDGYKNSDGINSLNKHFPRQIMIKRKLRSKDKCRNSS
ncbi:MAG: aminoglycoside nucleotidyltransferase [Clostridiales bacterium]|nr:aminoglycoside nucleotidyltransferase [Clostridiales bacterium]